MDKREKILHALNEIEYLRSIENDSSAMRKYVRNKLKENGTSTSYSYDNHLFRISDDFEKILNSYSNDIAVKNINTNIESVGKILTTWTLNEKAHEKDYDSSKYMKGLKDLIVPSKCRDKIIQATVKSCTVATNKDSKYIPNPMQIIGGRDSGRTITAYNPITLLNVYEDENCQTLKTITFNGQAPISIGTKIETEIPMGIEIKQIWKTGRFWKKEQVYPSEVLDIYENYSIKLNQPKVNETSNKIRIPKFDITYVA